MSDEQAKQLTAGQLLRQAREQRKLTVAQVALQLNLKPELVNKLEQDQFDGTLETFARGYVRAYGRLLKLSENELMAAFGQQTGCQQSSPKPMRTFSNRTAKQATENRFMWLTYAMIALLLVLLFIWWWQTERLSSTTDMDNSTEAVAVINSDVVTTAELDDIEMPTPEQVTELLEQLTPETATLAESPTLVTEPELDQLEMRFSQNCWVNVVDAEGNRVAYGTKQAGYIMQLTGTAPFTVTLGNPSVVEIMFNQKVIDMSALPAGRVAKFSIPESE